MKARSARLALSVVAMTLVASAAVGASYSLYTDQKEVGDTFACGTVVLNVIPPQGMVFQADAYVAHLAPGDQGWGKVPIQNNGTLDAWVWFDSYTTDGTVNTLSVFRAYGTDKLTLDHQNKVKLIPAGQTRTFDVSYSFPLVMPNSYQARTGKATLTFRGEQAQGNVAKGWTRTSFGGASTTFTTYSDHGGVVKFQTPSGNSGAAISQTGYTDAKLSDLTMLSYQTYVQSNSAVVPWAELLIDTNGDQTLDAVLQYHPEDNGAVSKNAWQNWNAAPDNHWRLLPPSAKDSSNNSSFTPTTLSAYRAAHPTARIIYDGGPGGLRFVAGKDGNVWNNLAVYVDNVVVTIGTETDTFKFD